MDFHVCWQTWAFLDSNCLCFKSTWMPSRSYRFDITPHAIHLTHLSSSYIRIHDSSSLHLNFSQLSLSWTYFFVKAWYLLTPPRAFQTTFGLPLGLHGWDDNDRLRLCYGPNISISYNYLVDLDFLQHNLIVDMSLELKIGCWPHLNYEIVGCNQVAKITHTIVANLTRIRF
jgi:hypothetical protein